MPLNVLVNCAMSLDGCVGLPGPRPLQLSGPEDLRRVHELRAACDAILVGVSTVLADDPKLTVKWDLIGRRGRPPLRVVLDARLRTPPRAQVVQGEAPTLLLHGANARPGGTRAERATVPVDGDGHLHLPTVLEVLGGRGIRNLMVEGGSRVISSFLTNHLVDKLCIYVAPRLVGLGDAPRLFAGSGPFDLGLRPELAAPLGEGMLLRWTRPARKKRAR